ncbi:hypothetical protein GQ43DRAFT_367969, partial [Delitschia confertaspora ATCC 74209]
PEATELAVLSQCHGKEVVQYTVLNYYWGDVAFFKTTPSNIEDMKMGFTAENACKPHCDAIWLVHKLGLEWIWTNQPCII